MNGKNESQQPRGKLFVKTAIGIAGVVLIVGLGGVSAQEAGNTTRPSIELLKTLDARGAFISLEGESLFLTSGVSTNVQQAGCWFFIGSDPASLALVCASLPAAWQVAVAGDYAFVCDYTKFLTVYSGRDRQWRQVARLAMPSQTENIVIHGKFACIANHVAGLTIVDISKPSKPSIVSNFNPGIDCDAVALYKDCAILYGHWESRLVLVDISDPAKPRQVGIYQHDPKTFNQGEMEVGGGFAYCTAVNGLVIVNVADPAHPKLAKTVPFKGATTDVVVEDRYVFVACRDGIRVLDVSEPANPTEVGSYKCAASQLVVKRAAAPASSGDYYIYVANKTGPAMVLRFRAPARGGGGRETSPAGQAPQ